MVASRSHVPVRLDVLTWWQTWRRRRRTATFSAALLVISAAGLWSPRESAAPLHAAANLGSEVEHGSSGCPALPWVPRGCQHLRHACLDQGTAVLYGREYQPSQASAARSVRPLPSWSQLKTAENYPFLTGSGSNPDYLTVPGLPPPQPPLTFRPVSAAEPTPEMASPQWSCQVPLILQTVYLYNYGHTLGNTAGWLFSRLVAQGGGRELAERALVAVATPWGLGLPAWVRALLQPMARHPVTTLADLSSRGNHTRCFADLLLCDQPHHWHAEAPYQASQHTVEYWRSTWSAQQPNITWHTACAAAVDSSSLRSPQQQQHRQQPVRTWRVLFQTRTEEVRQLTNLQQLLDRCAAWQYTDAATGTVHRAQCGVWPATAAPDVIAVAQAADIVVGLHGSNMANALFMRPGSALVELFHPDWNKQFMRRWLELDPKSQVHWWGVVVKDQGLFTPGAHERLQRRQGVLPYSGHWNAMMRDRNLELPWEVLRPVLDRVAAVNGSTSAYQQLAASGRNVVVVPARGLLPGVQHGLRKAANWLSSLAY